MTTIVTKNGSGAPLASDLVQGELAVDLTNKRLYTEDSGGTVIEVGTSPSTIDINAGTIDGTVIGGASAAAGTFTTFTSTGIDDNATSTAITIDSSQNVGIGTASPDARLESLVSSAGANIAKFADSANNRSLIFSASTAGSIIKTTENADEADADRALIFQRGATETMRIDSSGNVGIGTTSPTAGLECVNTLGAIVARSTQSSNTNVSLRFAGGAYTGNKATALLLDGVSGENRLYLGGGTSFGEPATDIRFHTGSAGVVGAGTERMRIDSSGHLSVGTTAVTSTVAGAITAGGTVTAKGPLATHQTACGVIDYNGDVTAIRCYGTTAGSGIFQVKTGGGGGSPDSTKMTVDASGNLLVGRTSTGVSSSSFGFEVRADGFTANSRNVSGTNGVWQAFGNQGRAQVLGDGDLQNTNNSYGAISDERLKSDIVDASSQIDDIMAVQVRSYTLNETGATHIGVVAQELEASGMSGLVKTDDEGMKSVKYSVLYMKAIKALQEAVTRIETLEAEVAALKGA